MPTPRKCDGCESEATVWCDECAQAICASCLVWHTKFNPYHDTQTLVCCGDRHDNDGDGDTTAAVKLGANGVGCDEESGAGIAHVLDSARIVNGGRDDDGCGSGRDENNWEEKTVVESGPTESGHASVVSSIAVVGRGGRGDDEWLQCCACSQPLRDPVQLQCLHNCCRSCLRTIALVKDGPENKERNGADAAAAAAVPMRPPPAKVRCPICNETCRTTVGRATDVLNANAFVARLAAQQQCDTIGGDALLPVGGSAAPEPLPQCDVCAEDEQSVEAQMWCAECSQALCSGCLVWHGKFNPRHAVTALGDGGASPSAAATLSPPVGAAARAVDTAAGEDVRCSLHAASPYEFECNQCGSLKCAECLKACVDRKHVVGLATDPREYVRRATERLRGAQLALESATGALSVNGDYERLLGGGGELAAAQAADARRLAMSRELAVAELQRTYAAAERALSEAYAEARKRAAAALGAVGAVRACSELARSYCERLLGTGDPGSVAQQQTVLLARMRALKKRAEAMLESPVPAAEDWVGLEAEKSPDFLAGALRKWLGMASLRDGLVDRLDVTCGGGGDGDNEEVVDSGDDEIDSESGGGELSVLRFERGAAGPAAAAECVDVALTADGHLLLAVIGEPNARGLFEYDAGGAELRRWRPPRPGGSGLHDFVCSVAALDDGRVAAGVLNAQAVQLLRRGPAADSWVRDRFIAVQLLPRRLSICGDMLAVSSGRFSSPPSNGGGFPDVLPGSSLAVLPNAAAEAVAAPPPTEPRDLGYNVLALALTVRALVVTSADRLEQPPPGGGSGLSPSYAVLALDRVTLTVLWQYASDESVAAVCVHGGALYLFSRDSGAVMAVDARRGKKVAVEVLRLGEVADNAARKAPVATAATPLSTSLRVVTATGGSDRLPVLAVLFADRRTTRVYPSADLGV